MVDFCEDGCYEGYEVAGKYLKYHDPGNLRSNRQSICSSCGDEVILGSVEGIINEI